MSESKIYIGPSIVNVVVTGTVFNGGITPKMEKEIANRPFLSDLIVPLETLVCAKKELRRSDSALSRIYQKAEGELK